MILVLEGFVFEKQERDGGGEEVRGDRQENQPVRGVIDCFLKGKVKNDAKAE